MNGFELKLNSKYGKRCLFFLMALVIFIFSTVAIIQTSNDKPPVKHLYNANPFYIFCEKHICPDCENELEVAYESVIVNSDSPEAKGYDFSNGDTYFKGDVEFKSGFFKCHNCDFEKSFDEMKKLEKENK